VLGLLWSARRGPRRSIVCRRPP